MKNQMTVLADLVQQGSKFVFKFTINYFLANGL